MLLLSLCGPVDCNFGDGVGILAQHVPNPAPSLSVDDGLHILWLAPCYEVMVGDDSWPENALDFPEACRVKGRQFGGDKLLVRAFSITLPLGQPHSAFKACLCVFCIFM